MIKFTSLVLTLGLLLISMTVGVLGRANVVGYYPNWVDMPKLNLNKYTHINFAFAIPQSDGSIVYDNQDAMPDLITNIHAANAKAIISIGGWTGSSLFSTILKDSTKRSSFLNNIVSFVQKYNLDGVDIDWEYPGRLGSSCNAYDPNSDTNNYLTFLQDLRAKFDATFGSNFKLITMAVRIEPFDGANGPVSDVSAFAKAVDYINLMTYDIGGPWNPTTSPNSPLQYSPGQGPQFSIASAIDAWSNAGWPTSQMNVGVAFYGYSMTTKQDMSKDPSNMYATISSTIPQGDKDDVRETAFCASGPAVYSGQWKWNHLRDQGLLSSPTTAAAPWIRTWDSTTSTPWLFNPNTSVFITYDDPQSIKLKIDYAASKGLAGTMVWSMNMDYNDELLDVLQTFSTTATPSNATKTTSESNRFSSFMIAMPIVVSSAPATTTSSTIPAISTAASTAISTTSTAISTTSTATSAASVTMSTTSIDASTSATTSEACTANGSYMCADSTGTNGSYFVCTNNAWIALTCGTGTACYQSGSSIYCGWPAQ